MNPIFQIKHGDAGENNHLSLIAGTNYLSYAVTDNKTKELSRISYQVTTATATEYWEEQGFVELLDSISRIGSFATIHIAYDFSGHVLYSSAFRAVHPGNSLVKILSGAGDRSAILTDTIEKWKLSNDFSIPGNLYSLLKQQFPGAIHRQQYSVMLKSIEVSGEDQFFIDFGHDSFSLLAFKKGDLLLARRFEYSHAEDVLYYLLKLCRFVSVSQEEVSLHLSGLIDQESALYRELYQYFTTISFRNPGWNGIQDFPPHYFTALNDLTQCAL